MYTQRDRGKHETERRQSTSCTPRERGKHETERTESISCTPRETERGKHETEMRDREAEESMRRRGETEYIIYTQRDRERKAQDRWRDGVHYV